MRIEKQQPYNYKPQNHNPKFRGFTEMVMGNIFLNKALFDLTSSDIPWVAMANNKEERRERINRSALSVGMVFVSPLILLPFVNRFAMKNITKLTSECGSKQWNAIKLSNKHLVSAEKTKAGLEELSKELKIDFTPIVDKVGGNYDKLRSKISTAKNIVLGTDLMLIAGSFGHIGFFNAWQTKKKTGQNGYSAELKMANKEIIEKRAEKFKKNEKFRYGAFLTGLAGLAVAMPMAIKRGITSQKVSKFGNFVKKHSDKFDYKDAIFMSRLPMALSFLAAHFGIFMASRNNTERKDNVIRSSSTLSIFFVGDILLASVLGRLSDKHLKTNLIKRDGENKLLNKILPPIKELKEIKTAGSPKSVKIAKGIFWLNFTFLSALMGVITPYFINKLIKKEVAMDANKGSKIKEKTRLNPSPFGERATFNLNGRPRMLESRVKGFATSSDVSGASPYSRDLTGHRNYNEQIASKFLIFDRL